MGPRLRGDDRCARGIASCSHRGCNSPALWSKTLLMAPPQKKGGLRSRASSLATRLFVSATAWVVVILLITGIVLSSVYRSATERAFDRRLNLSLRTLIAEVATPAEPPDHQFQSLSET